MKHFVLETAFRHRIVAKQILAALHRVLPRKLLRPLFSLAEKMAFSYASGYQSSTLPPIFAYWSTRHVRPVLLEHGFESPEDFFLKSILAQARREGAGAACSILSLGSGAAHFELDLLQALQDQGIAARLECVDFNRKLKAIAEARAAELGVAHDFRFTARDCNAPGSSARHDVVMVNQFFHHVEDLDAFCRSIREQLDEDGVLLTSDVIGRNGHLLWPTVEARVQAAWRELPREKTADRHFSGPQPSWRPVDHSAWSNEGVRAQDIVRTLLRYFDFELFLGYGGAIMPFVERRIGFNFSPDSADDCRFIDDLASADDEALRRQEYPACNMVAALRHKGRARRAAFFPASPEEHVRLTAREMGRGKG